MVVPFYEQQTHQPAKQPQPPQMDYVPGSLPEAQEMTFADTAPR